MASAQRNFLLSFINPHSVTLHSPSPPTRSLDYPGIGPEHSFLKDIGRAEYFSVTDQVPQGGGVGRHKGGSVMHGKPRRVALVISEPESPPLPPQLQEALDAFQRLSQLEGIIPALETSHAIAHLEKLAPTLKDGTRVVINCSGRGDKDGA